MEYKVYFFLFYIFRRIYDDELNTVILKKGNVKIRKYFEIRNVNVEIKR